MLKSNRGSETPGVDFKTMRKNYLQRSHSWVIKDIQNAFRHFEPQKIHRRYIDKPGKVEKRPLGIPTIRDRIVQECMRIVLEPIFEAQFFAHSYASKQELEQAIIRRHHAEQEESETPPTPPKAPPARGGMFYAQSWGTRREPPTPASLRTDLENT